MLLPTLFACASSEAVSPTYGLFVADGTFDPLDAGYVAPAFEDFFYDRLGYTPDELDRLRADAKQFYLDDYGLDVDAEVAAGHIVWNELRFDPRGDYRVYALPGLAVPADGWVLDDVTLAPTVIDPAGVALHGPYEGVVATPGMLGVMGVYAVDVLDEHGDPADPLFIDYHSDGLAANSYEGRSMLYCAMDSDDLGQGLGHVTAQVSQLDDGRLHYEFTNAQIWGE